MERIIRAVNAVLAASGDEHRSCCLGINPAFGALRLRRKVIE